MKKICILSSANIRHMTLISLYTEELKANGISYDIIYMDKYGENEQFEAENIYVYKNIIKKNTSKILKFFQYLKFVSYAKKILERNEYDFLIVWNEYTAMFFMRHLVKKWKNNYCLNYRDYLYQDKPIISILNRIVIKNSAFTTISSDGFRSFLPKHDYIHVHSFNKSILSRLQARTSLCTKEEKIKITFIGNNRFFDKNKQLLQIFKNDNRFELHFYGTNAEVLKEYSYANEIYNSIFHSTFPLEETTNYIKKTDLVNNLYGNYNKSLDYALSIKLYYGVYFRTPLLVNSNTYMAEKVNEYKIGYVVEEVNEELPDKIYKWYTNLDFKKFNDGCERFISDINKNNEKFLRKVKEYLL